MSRNFHDVRRGLSIDENVQIIATNGPPVGGDADVVGLGAIAIDFANGHLYQKNLAGSGSNKWQFIGADKSYREPALVRENTATVLPTATPSTNDTQDGVTITDGDRVLFSNLTVNPNVYIYDFATGTYSEDTNEATDGDTLMIEQGTSAGRSYTFNGTAWVLTGQAQEDELGFIRAFIGKNAAGSETPVYSSALVVTQNNDLEGAIGELDAALGLITDIADLQLLAVSGTNTLDSLLVDDYAGVKWLIVCRQGASMRSREVWASHDGQPPSGGDVDASAADNTEYASLNLGSAITGFNITIDVNGTGGSQVIRLQVTSTASADWYAKRIPVRY